MKTVHWIIAILLFLILLAIAPWLVLGIGGVVALIAPLVLAVAAVYYLIVGIIWAVRWYRNRRR